MSDESKRTWLTHPGKPGVIYREHPTRKTARKPDRFWAIRHRAGGKRLVETLGWTSEGWTADMAHALLVELQHNVKLGLRPQTLKEKRELAAGAKAEAARQSALEGLKEITFQDDDEHPSQLTAIYGEAFSMTAIETLTLPRSVETVLQSFENMGNLTTVRLGPNLGPDQLVGDFRYTPKLTNIEVDPANANYT
ncbi:MAG: hypothetical protein ACLU4B_12150, partial [Bilophila wadsworthia]